MKKTEIDPKDLTAEGLVALAKKTHAKVMKDAEKREKEHAASVAGLTEKEGELKFDIAGAKEQLEKMIIEFEALEKKEEAAILAKIDAEAVTEADVKSGKSTLTQFHAAGVRDDELRGQAKARALKALEIESDAIRSKAEGIVNLELSLFETQRSLQGLLLAPVRLLRQSYHDLEDLLTFQMEGYAASGNSARSLVDQKKNELVLIETGASVVSTGYVWQNVSMEEAHRIRFDPILPQEHVPLLVKALAEAEPIGGSGKTRVTVTYRHKASHWPGDAITVLVEEE